MAAIVSWFLFKTTKGFELRASGFNMTAARYAGMSASGSIILAMSLSGGLAGLGGSMEVLGTVPQMSNDISSGFGFNAIALALLAGNRPLGIVIAALLFGALRTGGGLMQVKTGIPLDLLFFIQALVIMFVAAPGLIRAIWRVDPRKKTPDARHRRYAGETRRADDRRERGMTAADAHRRASTSSHEDSSAAARAPAAIRPDPRRRPGGPRRCSRSSSRLHDGDDREVLVLDRQAGRRRRSSIQTTVGAPVDRDRRRHRRVGRVAALPRRVVPVARAPWRWSSRVGRRRPSRPCSTGKTGQPDRRASPGTLALAAPISLGAFAGILSERSGMLNIAIEGKFLIGRVRRLGRRERRRSSSSATDPSPFMLGVAAFIGVAAAAGAGILVGLLLAWLGIRWKVDQIIAGIVINIGALGITNFLFLRVLRRTPSSTRRRRVEAVKLPILGDIPVIGPILFNQTPYVYFTLLVMVAFTYMLFRTRWGLRLRASGEKPSAAGTVGIDVIKIRYRAMILAGILAGIAGSSLSLASAGSFQMDMSRRARVHRPRGGHLRRVEPDLRVRRRAGLRLRRRGPGAALDPRRRRPAAAPQQRPVHRDDHRRRGRRRPGARPGRGRPAVRPGLAGERGPQRRGLGTGPRDPHLPQGGGGGADGAVRDAASTRSR